MRSDLGHELTEQELAKLEKRVSSVYDTAAKDMQKTIDDYFKKFEARDAKMKELCSDPDKFAASVAGTASAGMTADEYYKQWRLAQIGRGERYEAMRDKLAERATKANETAISYVNDATPGIYSLNRNYTAYTIEQVAPNVDFALFDESTVRRLIKEQPDVMPSYPEERAVARGIDLAYGKQQITASVTSSILQGKSVPQMAKDLQTRITTMSKTSAVRAARTSVTAAQNAGRQDSITAAQNMGINVQKEWMATRDERTRPWHGEADGQRVKPEDSFKVGGEKMRFPGDPWGSGWNTYNCRCTMVSYFPDYPDKTPRQTYSEWLKEKKYFTFEDKNSNIKERMMANGLRKSPLKKLTNEDKKYVLSEASAIGISSSVIKFRDGQGTCYSDIRDAIFVSSSVFPSEDDSTNPTDRLSVRAVLAHEYYGHYISNKRGIYFDYGSWEDEFHASYMAAINTPNLSALDRSMLMQDAMQRASNAGVTIQPNKIMRKILYGYE